MARVGAAEDPGRHSRRRRRVPPSSEQAFDWVASARAHRAAKASHAAPSHRPAAAHPSATHTARWNRRQASTAQAPRLLSLNSAGKNREKMRRVEGELCLSVLLRVDVAQHNIVDWLVLQRRFEREPLAQQPVDQIVPSACAATAPFVPCNVGARSIPAQITAWRGVACARVTDDLISDSLIRSVVRTHARTL